MNTLAISQYQKLCKLLPEIRDRFGWVIDNSGWSMPWDGDFIGFKFSIDKDEVTPEKVAWLWQRECIAQVFDGQLVLAPQVGVIPPPRFYHTTLFDNVSNILEKGLLTGAEASRSTSKRTDCQGLIYVSFSLDSARSWAEVYRLGKDYLGQEWGIIMIDASSLTKRVFRDPCSVDGYILEDGTVRPAYVGLSERFISGIQP